MNLFDVLFDGNVGTVISGEDWNDDKGLYEFDGKYWDIDDEVGDIDKFFKKRDINKVTLYRSDGYRGQGCYSGWYKEKGKVYNLDIMNDYIVYKMVEAEDEIVPLPTI